MEWFRLVIVEISKPNNHIMLPSKIEVIFLVATQSDNIEWLSFNRFFLILISRYGLKILFQLDENIYYTIDDQRENWINTKHQEWKKKRYSNNYDNGYNDGGKRAHDRRIHMKKIWCKIIRNKVHRSPFDLFNNIANQSIGRKGIRSPAIFAESDVFSHILHWGTHLENTSSSAPIEH